MVYWRYTVKNKNRDDMKPQNIVLLGPPGSGKSTQADLLTKQNPLVHIDTGAVLRMLAKQDTPLGRKLDDILNIQKELVSDEVIREAYADVMTHIREDQGLLIDGAPRRMSQIQQVEEAIAVQGRVIDKVIYIHVSEKTSIDRIATRFSCTRCKITLVITKEEQESHSMKCRNCGKDLEQRADDTPEGVRKRLEVFEEETLPVIQYFMMQGKLLQVDGSRPMEEIYQTIIEGIFPKEEV